MRRPESYPNGTPRSPRFEDNEEEATPAYMSPRNATQQNEDHHIGSAALSDPLSLNNRARTPPPPEQAVFQQNPPPFHHAPPPVNGLPAGLQPSMPPFFSPLPNQYMYPPPFAQNPYMPVQNQFGKFRYHFSCFFVCRRSSN
ncbi:hypothetical protein OESDEN_02262 [Oesophagostomum dentatum]|uniref:Uncharacterized protein n=1 Tax=Oesophagostomum dentatum TaxID=61180 RepID=A0A0B1TNT8_OESDE|nr:hypothetical protein OESDEN_02262 [Oesophagostomum dentatum]